MISLGKFDLIFLHIDLRIFYGIFWGLEAKLTGMQLQSQFLFLVKSRTLRNLPQKVLKFSGLFKAPT